MKTIKQAIEESSVNTAITENGSIYKQIEEGKYQRVCGGGDLEPLAKRLRS